MTRATETKAGPWTPPFCALDTKLTCPVCKDPETVRVREQSTYYDGDMVEGYCSSCHASLDVCASVTIEFSDSGQRMVTRATETKAEPRLTKNDQRVLDSVKFACGEWDGFAPHGSADWAGVRRLLEADLIEFVCGDGRCQTCSESHDTHVYRMKEAGDEDS